MVQLTNEIKFESLLISGVNHSLDILPMFGTVKTRDNCFSYLDIDNNFIHQIFPLICNEHIKKPAYFDKESNFIGAHISIMYPEESTCISEYEKESQVVTFEITGLFKVYFPWKKYYVLKVVAPALSKMRLRHGLTEKLKFKGYFVDFHITVGVEEVL